MSTQTNPFPQDKPTVTLDFSGRATLKCCRVTLSENCGYFRAMLQGQFSEAGLDTFTVKCTDDFATLFLFFTWVGLGQNVFLYISGLTTVWDFLEFGEFYQIRVDLTLQIASHLFLPRHPGNMTQQQVHTWSRVTIPFEIAHIVLENIEDKPLRLEYLFIWFSELLVSSESEQVNLTLSQDFSKMKDYVRNWRGYSLPVKKMAVLTQSYPIASRVFSTSFILENLQQDPSCYKQSDITFKVH